MGFKHAPVLPAPPMGVFQWMAPPNGVSTGPQFISYFPHHDKGMKVRRPRRRRAFSELSRDIVCPHPDCGRCYASKHALNLHLRIKHSGSSTPSDGSGSEQGKDSATTPTEAQSSLQTTSGTSQPGAMVNPKLEPVEEEPEDYEEEDTLSLPAIKKQQPQERTVDTKPTPAPFRNLYSTHQHPHTTQQQQQAPNFSAGPVRRKSSLSSSCSTPFSDSPGSPTSFGYTSPSPSLDTPMLSSYPLVDCNGLNFNGAHSYESLLDAQAFSALGDTFPLLRSNSCPSAFDMSLPITPDVGYPSNAHAAAGWPGVLTPNPVTAVGGFAPMGMGSVQDPFLNGTPYGMSTGGFGANGIVGSAAAAASGQSLGLLGLGAPNGSEELGPGGLAGNLGLDQPGALDDFNINDLFRELQGLMS
eukprot:comp23531_c1_seq1/m.39599 comp23531_c1_seq1/g.39599  ORF comp23531_c1_seq1/g.39599 comp23531_c1_seq1/m.39599 type:complete len:413 (-) comp23531_c1_seq1:501-1739(-)